MANRDLLIDVVKRKKTFYNTGYVEPISGKTIQIARNLAGEPIAVVSVYTTVFRKKQPQMSAQQKGWLKRCQAVEPAIGHLKSDHRLDRCWLKGSMGDALHAISCAAGYNIRWLLRAIARLGIASLFLRLLHRKMNSALGVGPSCKPASALGARICGTGLQNRLRAERHLGQAWARRLIESGFCRADLTFLDSRPAAMHPSTC